MEALFCILGGILLVLCGGGLFFVRPPNWTEDGQLVDVERVAIERWSLVQRAVRYTNNSLVILIGILIFSTAFFPHNKVWAMLWMAIFVSLLLCILLAMIDAFSSLAGYKRALPEAARRSFKDGST